MTFADQRYFGDWVRFNGRPDTGYYLGARFAQYLLRGRTFDDIIDADIREIREAFDGFSDALY